MNINAQTTKLISGSSSIKLAQKLANELGLQLIQNTTKKFADGELSICIEEDLYNKQVIIVQSTSEPVNNNLMELLFIADHSKKMGAKHVTAIIPYFGYSRQDRAIDNRSIVPMRMVAMMLEIAGIDKIITVDMHSLNSIGFFRIIVNNINTTSIFASLTSQKFATEQHTNLSIISPDIGGIQRARLLSSALGCSLSIINKTRDKNSKCYLHEIIGNVKNRECIIIDDITDNGDTLLNTVNLLLDNNAASVCAYITHCVISDKNYNKFEYSQLKKIYITDTIQKDELLPKKFCTISIVPLLIKSLHGIMEQ